MVERPQPRADCDSTDPGLRLPVQWGPDRVQPAGGAGLVIRVLRCRSVFGTSSVNSPRQNREFRAPDCGLRFGSSSGATLGGLDVNTVAGVWTFRATRSGSA